ncbi:putative ribonuclease H-like domain-containing protein [Tanacetum coccineum]
MYSVNLKNIVPKGGLTCLFAKETSDESKLWHRRLGHINFKTMNKLVKGNLVRGLPLKLFENSQTCVACQKGKQHRASYKSKPVSSISQPLNTLHMDLFGLTFVKSLMKKMYCLVVTDGYRRISWVFFLATKDETSGIIKSFITRVENLIDQRVKVIRCENGTEFKNKEINQFCERKDHLGKFDGKADEGFFIRYSINSKAFRVFNNRTRIVEENMHVQFSKDIPNIAGSTKACDDAGKARMETVPGDDEKKFTEEPRKESGDPSKECERDDQEKDADVNNTNIVYTVSSFVNIIGSSFVNADGSTFVNATDLPDDPNMPPLEDIVYSDDDEDVGVEADMNNLDPFMNKKDERGVMIRNKASLVSQRYIQEEGIDYHEVFTLVARIEAIRLFLAYASFKDVLVYQIDVKSAILYGKIKEEVYVCQPPGFKDPDFPDRVYKVEKALYRLHQALRAWYETLSTYLLDNGFQRGKIDKTFFIRRDKGLQVMQKEDGIFISQDKYVTEILKKLSKDENGEDIDEHMYRSMIGSLMYLTSSRPDIMFAVCSCARYQVNLKVLHLHALKIIFRYLKGQLKLGLWYPKDSPFDLVAYTDSDYAGASLDRKSTTGGYQFLGCRLISWQCKKQTIVANSTTKAEYVAASNCYGQVLWIQNQLLDYGYNIMHTKIYIDNESTICIVKNPIFHSKTKHIEIRHHFIRDSNEKKLIQMVKIHTDKNIADFLTKAFDVSRFQYLIASIGMLNL